MVSTTAATPRARRDARDVYRMKLALEYTANLRQHGAHEPPTYPFLTARQMEPIYQDVHQSLVRSLVTDLGIAQTVWISWANPVSASHTLNTESDYELLARVQHMRTRTEEERASRRFPGPSARRTLEPEEDEDESLTEEDEENEIEERSYTGVGNLSAREARVQAMTGVEPGYHDLTPAQAARRRRTEEYIRSIERVMPPEGAEEPEPPEPGKRRLRVRKP